MLREWVPFCHLGHQMGPFGTRRFTQVSFRFNKGKRDEWKALFMSMDLTVILSVLVRATTWKLLEYENTSIQVSLHTSVSRVSNVKTHELRQTSSGNEGDSKIHVALLMHAFFFSGASTTSYKRLWNQKEPLKKILDVDFPSCWGLRNVYVKCRVAYWIHASCKQYIQYCSHVVCQYHKTTVRMSKKVTFTTRTAFLLLFISVTIGDIVYSPSQYLHSYDTQVLYRQLWNASLSKLTVK